jgi:lipoprotein-anchoring transpeptidase ErfK/SrfK
MLGTLMQGFRLFFFAVAILLAPTATAGAEVLITVDKSAQQMTVRVDGALRWTWHVSTGRRGHETPNGTYTAFRMEEDHYSEELDDAPMPHSIFFTKRGHAIHGSYETSRLGTPVSHGCVRLHPDNAEKLYALVEQTGLTNTKVMITSSSD